MQGVFVKRHQIIKEEDGSPFSPADLSVGQTVTVYGRTFFIVDADTFTRSWYAQQLGVDLADAGTYPADPVEAYRQHFGLSSAPSKHQPLLQGTACKLNCEPLFTVLASHETQDSTAHDVPCKLWVDHVRLHPPCNWH